MVSDPLKADIKLTKSSGDPVEMATTVNPMTNLLIPSEIAILEAPTTKNLAPPYNRAIPIRAKMMVMIRATDKSPKTL